MSDWRAARLVFWDFDGVIKRSTEVKTQAFVQLFRPFGRAVAERVRAHHLENGGLSRFEKIPHYLEWAGQQATPERIEDYCQRFATLVRQAVIDAEWVPGAERLLRTNPFGQIFILVTATPLAEIEEILNADRPPQLFRRRIRSADEKGRRDAPSARQVFVCARVLRGHWRCARGL